MSGRMACWLAWLDAHGGGVTAIATIFIAIFTIVLAWVSGRQARLIGRQITLMQVQFDQWITLANWRTKKPEPNNFKIWVDLVNRTGFPVTLNGHLKIDDNTKHITTYNLQENTFLSPNDPRAIELDIGKDMAPEQLASLQSASFRVTGMFSHHHRITGKEVTQSLIGRIECSPWQSDHKWHVIFIPIVDVNPEIQEKK